MNKRRPQRENSLYLILAEEWEVKKNFNGIRIGSEHNELGDTTIEGFGD